MTLESDDDREDARLLTVSDKAAAGSAPEVAPSAPRLAGRFPSWFWVLLSLFFLLSLLKPLASLGCGGPHAVPWLFPSAAAPRRPSGDRYLIGVGKADITGPVVEINLMGYANPGQVGAGLRQRLYSRAFIVGDVGNPADRFVYLVLDTQSGDTAVRYGVLRGLRKLGPAYAVYGHQNLALTGTHSHSGPGGWLNYLLPQITSKGFDHQGYRAIVDGVLLSIQRAHESLQPGYLSLGSTKVAGANINRSLFSYLANPAEERARYNTSSSAEDDGSVEKGLTLLKFQRESDGKNIGVLTWFPTHGTSMLRNNTLVSGDNKGVAAYLFERSVRDGNDGSAAEGFVAGFSQASVGDTSPNVLGAWCEDGSGAMCTLENSTCGGKAQPCQGRGPGFRVSDEGASSCFEIGRRQFEPARALYDRMNREQDAATTTTNNPVRGPWVRSFHTFHNMSYYAFALPNGTRVRTCPAALGYSFAAGTSDGAGAINFTQHDSDPSNTTPVWRAVSYLLKAPSDAQKACHGAKPILLDVGELERPYQWTPNVVDVQVFRVGQLVIVVSPGEATTMAGRRWKDAVRDACAAADSPSRATPVVVLGGPANSYTHYITTEEEYAIQRYEGASTLYGPHTLNAYINVTLSFLPYLSPSSKSRPPRDGAALPPDNTNRSLSFITGVVRDGPPLFKAFGDVTADVARLYRRGDVVAATFVGANPRNNLRQEETYAAVEKLDVPFVAHQPHRPDDNGIIAEAEAVDSSEEGGKWKVVRDDADWSLVFRWERTSEILATSQVEIRWETEAGAEPGIYRLRYYGDSKALGGTITPFEGVSSSFTLL